jgi:uncharacterized oligopeptide transporter (OPT) family protein
MASGGLSNVFVSAFPAMYQLGLLSTPKEDFWKIVSLTAVAGYFGYFFATPMRKFFIIYVARELRLIFPTASATAMTIRSMHQAVTGEAMAKMKMKGLSIAFTIALLIRVVSQYAVGILWDWHFFTWQVFSNINFQSHSNKYKVLHLGEVQQLGSRCRELGLVPRVDSCFHWLRYACRPQRFPLLPRWLRSCLGNHRPCARS